MLVSELKSNIIIPTLDYLTHSCAKSLNSNAAIKLLLLTAAVESLCGKYLTQAPEGKALGIYQIEPATYYDLHKNFLHFNTEFLPILRDIRITAEFGANEPNLIGNLYYSTAIARLIYWRYPEKLPNVDDNDGLWEYYKKYFNSSEGKATKELFFENAKYCGVIE